jgi:hypothetical protein
MDRPAMKPAEVEKLRTVTVRSWPQPASSWRRAAMAAHPLASDAAIEAAANSAAATKARARNVANIVQNLACASTRGTGVEDVWKTVYG